MIQDRLRQALAVYNIPRVAKNDQSEDAVARMLADVVSAVDPLPIGYSTRNKLGFPDE